MQLNRSLAATYIAIIIAVASGLLLYPTSNTEKKIRRPNIVFIMTDDQGYETVGAYGAESYRTPNIDNLAKTGILFEQAHATPVCTSTRVKLMSGQYNSRNYTGFGIMDANIYTFGNLFKEAGYATLIAGKWQLGGDFKTPNNFGFDEYVLWQLTRRGRGGVSPIANRYPNPGLEINGEERNFRDGSYGPDIANQYVLDFIERHREEPFFIYYPMVLPHWPFEPTPLSSDWDPNARINDSEEKPGLGNPLYFVDMVEYADRLVGTVVKKLESLGLRENTLVVFTSDNGSQSGIVSIVDGKKVIGGKGTLLETGTRVPLVMNWPSVIKPGQRNSDLISFTYFFPTLAEIAGINISNQLSLDGLSIAKLLRGDKIELPDTLYMWWFMWNDPNKLGGEFARTKQYKLYHDGRFYDLPSDPQERMPLKDEELTSEQQAEKIRLLKIMQDNTRKGFYN
jgi:arylsulfatase A